MGFDLQRAARDIGRDAVASARWLARALSSASTWHRAGRSFKNSFIGSLINNLLGLLLVVLALVGFWLNDKLGVPEAPLYAAGIGALFLAAWLNRQLWRSYARKWIGRRRRRGSFR